MSSTKIHQEIISLAMQKLQWNRKKVMSWYKLENPHLGGARPEELVNRGESAQVIALLEHRERERKINQSNKSPSTMRSGMKK